MRALIPVLACSIFSAHVALGHDGVGDLSKLDAAEKEILRKHLLDDWKKQAASRGMMPVGFAAQGAVSPPSGKPPQQIAAFQPFMPRVKVRWDESWLFVESNGMPAHPMMIGITNWQQHVPIPQDYHGTNAWRIPLHPVPAKAPQTVRDHFLRGAIAIAVNGVPIFNPQNNRGEYSAEIGELDQWGGHCGRADDYHYHAAPIHLQSIAGKDSPIAFALDGYSIHGPAEADGSSPSGLDTFHGHEHGTLGYHYHASTKRPYVNGGFHGEVVEREGQVDPQPSGQPARGALPPMRGAKITDFISTGADSYKLSFDLNGRGGNTVSYHVTSDGHVAFEFHNALGESWSETYLRRKPRGGAEQKPGRQ